MTRGTLSLSWGPYGGFYLHPRRLCLGWLAITYVCVEVDDLMEAYIGRGDLLSAAKQWRQATESRLRLVTNREMSDSLLAPDKALFDAIDRAEGKS